MRSGPRRQQAAVGRLGRLSGPVLTALVLAPVAALAVVAGSRLMQQCFTTGSVPGVLTGLDLLTATGWCPDGSMGLGPIGSALVVVIQAALCLASAQTVVGAGGVGLVVLVVRCTGAALRLARSALRRMPVLRVTAGPRLTRAGPPRSTLRVPVATSVASSRPLRGPPVAA